MEFSYRLVAIYTSFSFQRLIGITIALSARRDGEGRGCTGGGE